MTDSMTTQPQARKVIVGRRYAQACPRRRGGRHLGAQLQQPRTAGRTLDDAVRTHHRGLHGARESVTRALTQLWQQQQRARERQRGPERDFGPSR